MRNLKTTIALAIAACAALVIAPTSAQAPKPKHINRVIELLEKDQTVYYTGSHSGTAGTFEQGKADASTYADYLSYDMEHAPFDVRGLSEYMKGLAAAGPTKSGHRTPAVIVNVPVNGLDEATVRANAWMFQQVLATGVHGILLCHADTPGAARAFVEAVRMPNHKEGVGKGLSEGRRGVHGSPTAAAIWGITPEEYEQKADVWPLNPNGELIIGLKIEDKYALENVEATLETPGIGFAEWGPGDMALSLGVTGPNPTAAPPMRAARNRVFAATKAHKIFFLESMSPQNVIDEIKEGVRVGPANQEATEIGRKFQKRELPW